MKINSAIQNQIVKLLQWDDGRYEKFVFECGNAYLYAYIKQEAEEIINEIKRSTIFWNWWKLHWATRDQEFIDIIECAEGELRKDIARQLYQQKHDPAMLACELYPNGEVLGETYAKMINELNQVAIRS